MFVSFAIFFILESVGGFALFRLRVESENIPLKKVSGYTTHVASTSVDIGMLLKYNLIFKSVWYIVVSVAFGVDSRLTWRVTSCARTGDAL
jgi:hypothetical protein